MTQALRAPVELFDYFAGEERGNVRHEYVGGELHAMVGGTLRHNRIGLNIATRFVERTRAAPCEVFLADTKLHVRATDSIYYPDVIVVCGAKLDPSAHAVDDATLVVEVTSDSTASIDRREKLVAYRKLPGLRGYWIVSQTEQRVEVHERDADGVWRATAFGAGESIAVGWLDGAVFALADFYAGTDVVA